MVEAVLGGAVLVMSYFGAVSVEAVSEWGRFDQGEREIKFISLLGTEDIGVHIVHISRVL